MATALRDGIAALLIASLVACSGGVFNRHNDSQVAIVFPNGGATLTQAVNRQLDTAGRQLRDGGPLMVYTVSTTPSSDAKETRLGALRVEAVRRGLAARGIMARAITTALSAGEETTPSEPGQVLITWRGSERVDGGS